MKYIYLLTALIFMGCSDKSASVKKLPQSKEKTEVAKVVNVVELTERKPETVKYEAVKHELNKNERYIEEAKIIKNIASDVPTSCAMWSDGSNVCTRVSTKKASCTTNPVEQRMFSCLQWQ